MMRTLFWLGWLGCADSTTADTSDATLNIDEPDSENAEACETSVRVNAVPVEELPNPRVGDSWTLIMYCDDTVLMGPAVLRIDPTDLATLDSATPTLTFIKAGAGEIEYQLGNRRVAIPVTIEEAS